MSSTYTDPVPSEEIGDSSLSINRRSDFRGIRTPRPTTGDRLTKKKVTARPLVIILVYTSPNVPNLSLFTMSRTDPTILGMILYLSDSESMRISFYMRMSGSLEVSADS